MYSCYTPVIDTGQMPMLVLIPGLLNTAQIWHGIRESLEAHYPLVFAETHHHDSLEATAASILQQIPGQTFALAGFSMGGYVALEMLRQAPKAVTHLAFINSKAEPDTTGEHKQRALSIRSAKIGRFVGVTPRLMQRLVHADQHDNTALHQTVYAMAAEIGRQGFLNQQKANMTRKDLRPILKKFHKPTLLLSGAADEIIRPETSFAARKYLPHAKTVLLPRTGHLSPLEAPEAMGKALMEWLSMVSDKK